MWERSSIRVVAAAAALLIARQSVATLTQIARACIARPSPEAQPQYHWPLVNVQASSEALRILIGNLFLFKK